MAIKVGMVSLGCPKNQVDAEILLSDLNKAGYELTPDAALAQVVIINTCGFIESAKQESIEEILEFCKLKQEGRVAKIVVTGCLAERYRDEIMREIPEVDVVLGIGSNKELVTAIQKAMQGDKIKSFGEKQALTLSGERILTTLPFFAYLKIAEGCDNCCTYCAIPSIRGGYRSRPMEEILDEANTLVNEGVRELVLVAQDTTRYGQDLYGKLMLPKLVQEICKIEKLHWLRILYAYPDYLTEELMEVMAAEPKVVKYLDIPIQHISEQVLSAMNRRGDKDSLISLIAKLRRKVPGITLRTTLIAGFPGETEEQFNQLCEFVKETGFERLGCFAYSAEEGTAAAEFDGQLSQEVKEHRVELIMTEQMRVHDRLNESLLGKTLEVVVEGYDKYAGCFFGRSAMDAPDIDTKVFFTAKRPLKLGEFVKVTLEDTVDYDLMGAVKEDNE